MAKFWIDYSTTVVIEAESAEEAENLFWDGTFKLVSGPEISINAIEEIKN